jgi:phospholipid/cholesterol/gamma-HCH transport system permease protein
LVSVQESDGLVVVGLAGDLVISALERLDAELRDLPRNGPMTLDLSDVDHLDTAGAWRLVTLRDRLRGEGLEVELRGASSAQKLLIGTVEESLPKSEPPAPPRRNPLGPVAELGRWIAQAGGFVIDQLGFLGLVVARLGHTLLHPGRLRLTSVVAHMQEVGLNAMPIVSLMSFLIGVVLAYQGALQLRPFGAEVFVVDLIAISIFRELGILLTAIIVAGRSASAFTAAIGSMKMREEIDAMRTLGLDPIDILVLPRLLAILLVLPALGLIADVMGLLGGAVMAWAELGVSPNVFTVRLLEADAVDDFLAGLFKAPFFAAIIAIVGCFEGMKVGSSAESLGRQTSTSVVLSIFLVIVADAGFSIFFAALGI